MDLLKESKGIKNGFRKLVISRGCIAATIVAKILFVGSATKRLQRKACVPPWCSINFFSKNTLHHYTVVLIFLQKIRYSINQKTIL